MMQTMDLPKNIVFHLTKEEVTSENLYIYY